MEIEIKPVLEICGGILGVAALGYLGLRAYFAKRDYSSKSEKPTFEVVDPNVEASKSLRDALRKQREGYNNAKRGNLPK